MIHIREIESHEIDTIKYLYSLINFEQLPGRWATIDAAHQYLTQIGRFNEFDSIPTRYWADRGLFLVIIDITTRTIIGFGGIRHFNNNIGELRRIRLMKEYRGKGLGKKLLQHLIDHAYSVQFDAIYLEVDYPEIHQPALNLYKQYGFYPREQYASSLSFAMEKCLKKNRNL